MRPANSIVSMLRVHRVSALRRAPSCALGLAIAFCAGIVGAQSDEDTGAPAPAPAAPPAGQMLEVAPPTTTTTAYGTTFLPPPGANLEKHLESSAHSKADIYEPDSFDFQAPGSTTQTVHGDPNALGVLGNSGSGAADQSKGFYIVHKGDTLWQVSGDQLGDPRLWPRMWSFNPQLQNPHWIYPGDQLRLRAPGSMPAGELATSTAGGGFHGGTLGTGAVGRAASVPADTRFLRELGYIDEPERDTWGSVVGAREEQQLLSDPNHVYMILRPGAQVQLGQLMTIFEDVRDPPTPNGARRPPGKIVLFKGTVKIDSWDESHRIARGEVVEALDVIERGAKVGPIGRRYFVVPPAPSQVDVDARVLTSLYPHLILGRDQVVFIDRGANDGLKPGNRLFIVRHGDTWRRTLVTASPMARMRILMDLPDRVEITQTPLDGDEELFPEEVVGELRVIRSHPFSSLALVTESREEIEPGDQAVTRKGL
ncbi:MAG TPA: LysM peptidoglycan-binding domain-containing protein [Polyangiaceae bacterium]|nr:LysM peptidoglycan-binding domain-containing protein [Polyangiaceae bacterium]